MRLARLRHGHLAREMALGIANRMDVSIERGSRGVDFPLRSVSAQPLLCFR
jgi:hypothetical protein